MGIYMLEEQHEKLYRELQDICEMNKEKMIGQMVNFIRYRFKKTRQKAAVIGASGGVDSSLTAKLAVLALGPKNVLLVKLPYDGLTSKESSDYVDLLAKACGIPERNVSEVSIKSSTDCSLEELRNKGFDLASVDMGNMMARERMKMLFAIARIKGGMVLDTCNFTEIMLGYLTKFGDGASDLNAVWSLYKTWVWILASYMGVPEQIVRRVPIAELCAGQTDESDLGISYPVADTILWMRYARKISKRKLVCEYKFPKKVIEIVEKRVKISKHKSSPTPVCWIKL